MEVDCKIAKVHFLIYVKTNRLEVPELCRVQFNETTHKTVAKFINRGAIKI